MLTVPAVEQPDALVEMYEVRAEASKGRSEQRDILRDLCSNKSKSLYERLSREKEVKKKPMPGRHARQS